MTPLTAPVQLLQRPVRRRRLLETCGYGCAADARMRWPVEAKVTEAFWKIAACVEPTERGVEFEKLKDTCQMKLMR